MIGTSIHPVFIVMAVVSIGAALYDLQLRSRYAGPAFLLLSLAALIARAAYLLREQRRRRSPAGEIDFEMLRGKVITRCADWLKENVRGHDQTIDPLLNRLQRSLSLVGPGRPLGAYLLAGPSGTGKAYLSRLLSHALYPESEALVLDMSDYRSAADVGLLLDVPPMGAPGHETGGTLTQPVLDNPYRVIILDEVQKCHPDVLRNLGDILNSGRCREKSTGRTVHFNACVIFATCSADAADLRPDAGGPADAGARDARLRDVLCRSTGLEKSFVARFDEVFVMDALAAVHVAEVVCLQLAKHLRDFGIEMTYASPELVFEVIRRNSEFKEHGVRELAHLTRSLIEPAVERAKQGGANRVRLGFDKTSGEVTSLLQDGL